LDALIKEINIEIGKRKTDKGKLIFFIEKNVKALSMNNLK